MSCLFCKIINHNIPANIIYEDERVIAFLDIAPVNFGHTLVVPKEHHADLLSTPPELACYCVEIIKKITPAILKGVKADSFNIGINNGKTAGQVVDHLHWHIMPRFKNDNYELWQGQEYKDGQAEQVLKEIKNNI